MCPFSKIISFHLERSSIISPKSHNSLISLPLYSTAGPWCPHRSLKMFPRTTPRRLWRSKHTHISTCHWPVSTLAATEQWWRRLSRRLPATRARRRPLSVLTSKSPMSFTVRSCILRCSPLTFSYSLSFQVSYYLLEVHVLCCAYHRLRQHYLHLKKAKRPRSAYIAPGSRASKYLFIEKVILKK